MDVTLSRFSINEVESDFFKPNFKEFTLESELLDWDNHYSDLEVLSVQRYSNINRDTATTVLDTYYANYIHAKYKVEEKPKGRVYVNQTMRAT